MSEMMQQAVERQQTMLAADYTLERQSAESARAYELGRYLELLQNPAELLDETIANEFSGLAKKFYIPRTTEEECRIMDAGGSTYGV